MKKHALLVDDSHMYRTMLKNFLEELDIRVTTVSSGNAAYKQLKSAPEYDIIFMDIEMKGENGMDVYSNIKNSLNLDIPAIAITGHSDTGFKRKLQQRGFKNYLVKPIDKKDLLRKTTAILNITQASDETHSDPEINIETLKELAEGDEDFFKETLRTILSEAESASEYMQGYVNNNQWKELRDFAHTLYSKVAYLGIPYLHNDIKLIEQYAKDEYQRDKITEIIKRFELNITDIIPKIQEEYLK